MNDKILGLIQFVLVCVFIVASVMISMSLKPQKSQIQSDSKEERVLLVETVTVSPQSHKIEFQTTGNVEVRSEIGIVPEVNGRLISVDNNFFAGGTFEADQTLFQIDLRDFELEVERLEAEVARARTVFNLEQAESKAAIEEWKIVNGDKKAPPLVARKPQMDEAWANLKAAKALLEGAKLDLERSSFSFPFRGRVLSSNLETGQFVMSGQNYGSVFDLASLEIRASLKDKELSWLLNNDNPDINVIIEKNNKTKTYKAKLNRAAASLDMQTRFATVSLGFAEDIEDILPGEFARIEIKSSEIENVALFPASALQKEGIIWVLQDDGTMKSVKPEIIYSTEETIIAQGFGDNKKVIINRVSGAVDGMKASIASDQQSNEQQQSNGT